jgi:hypothetical protein
MHERLERRLGGRWNSQCRALKSAFPRFFCGELVCVVFRAFHFPAIKGTPVSSAKQTPAQMHPSPLRRARAGQPSKPVSREIRAGNELGGVVDVRAWGMAGPLRCLGTGYEERAELLKGAVSRARKAQGVTAQMPASCGTRGAGRGAHDVRNDSTPAPGGACCPLGTSQLAARTSCTHWMHSSPWLLVARIYIEAYRSST